MPRFAQPDANLAGKFGVIFYKQEVHGVRESMLHGIEAAAPDLAMHYQTIT
jgi:hypothetical protein